MNASDLTEGLLRARHNRIVEFCFGLDFGLDIRLSVKGKNRTRKGILRRRIVILLEVVLSESLILSSQFLPHQRYQEENLQYKFM